MISKGKSLSERGLGYVRCRSLESSAKHSSNNANRRCGILEAASDLGKLGEIFWAVRGQGSRGNVQIAARYSKNTAELRT
jgi:hypothetical protein